MRQYGVLILIVAPHTAVDDARGVVLDVAVTTGEVNEGETIEAQVDAVQDIADRAITSVTGDAGYAYAKVYGALERRGIDPLIPAKKEPIKSRVPTRRFRYDPRHDIVKCPRGKVLRPGRALKYGRFFHSRSRDCARCTPRATACPRDASTRRWSSAMTIRRCSAPGAGAHAGARTIDDSTNVIAGVRRASMARQRPGTGWAAPSGAASTT